MLTLYLSIIENHENDDIFIEIYNKYKSSMYKVAFTYLNDHHLTEDALQVAFSGIARNIDKIKKLSKENQEIYILKCAKNASLSILADNSSGDNTYNFYEHFMSEPTSDDALENAIEKELLNEIVCFIQKMDEKYRDVLSLYFLHELTFKEIATALNTPVSTVKDRFRKGHMLVLEKFKEYRK